MKTSLNQILAIFAIATSLVACTKTEVESTLTADITNIKDVDAQNPSAVAVSISSNVNWIIQAPKWVKPSETFGSGNSIVTFTFDPNFTDAETTVQPRSGEIKISGGGTLNGNGATLMIPVSQLGFTYVDTGEPLGGIPSAKQFVKFIKAASTGSAVTRWMDANNEVVLLDNIDLGQVTNAEWQALVAEATNGNNDCTLTSAFEGIFNGNGFKITNFNPEVVLAANNTFGLFPVISGATIKNVELSGMMTVSATGQADAGMLVGTALNSTIKDVIVNGKIISPGTTASSRFATGGVCGFICSKEDNNSLIENCTSNVEAEVIGGTNSANGAGAAQYGGIVGFSTYNKKSGKVTISNCTNNGNMKVTLGRCSGIVATPNGGSIITDCVNNGDQVNSIADGRLGNICCVIGQDGKIINCVNNGNLEANAYTTGGTAAGIAAMLNHNSVIMEGGANYGTIKSSRADGELTGLLVANFSKFASVKNVVVSGGLVINGAAIDINASNYMQYIGKYTDATNITGLSWEDPKN